MPRVTFTQNNFNGGEWSPLTYGRSDMERYRNALSLCKNYISTVQGGLTRRPGTYYVSNTKSNGAVRFVRFEFSITQAYILEFGNNYVRFYTNGGRLETSPGVAYEVATPYTTADLWGLAFTQSADVLYIAHPSYAPRKLIRGGALSWTLSTITFVDGPYLLLNFSSTTLTSSAAGPGAATVTASATAGINGGTGFTANDVGRMIRLKAGANWGWGTITAFTSSTQVTVNWITPVGTTASSVWRLGVWGLANGYPRAIAFHQDRLLLAGCAAYPNRVDGSNVSDYENFAPTDNTGLVVDSNAVSFSLNASSVNVINWMVSDEWGLLCGTPSGEWVIAASTQQTALTPTNVNTKQTSSYGSTSVEPKRIGKSTLFVQRAKRKIRELAYQFTLGTFQAPDISLVSEHLTKSGVKQMAVMMQPQPILWVLRTDGVLVGVTYDRDQQVIAWHQHEFGGTSYGGVGGNPAAYPPIVESIEVIPSTDGSRDELWLCVYRYINGAQTRTVERMAKFWEDGTDVRDAYFVDCGATYDGVGVSTMTVSGLTWLANETVSILADGATHPNVTVSPAGVVTLTRPAVKVQIGYNDPAQGRTMRIEAGGADGSAQGKRKRIHRAIFRFFQTVGIQVQRTASNDWDTPPWRAAADLMDQPTPLYDGDMVVQWDGTWEREGWLTFRQNDPLPSNILMLSAQLETNDG